MKKTFLVLLLGASLPLTALAEEPADFVESEAEAAETEKQHISARIVLKVTDRDAAANALIAQCESKRGYYASRTDNQLHLKMPREAVKSFLEFSEKQGMIADRSFSSQSMSQSLVDIGAKMAAEKSCIFASCPEARKRLKEKEYWATGCRRRRKRRQWRGPGQR